MVIFTIHFPVGYLQKIIGLSDVTFQRRSAGEKSRIKLVGPECIREEIVRFCCPGQISSVYLVQVARRGRIEQVDFTAGALLLKCISSIKSSIL